MEKVDKKSTEDIYALTSSQEGLLFHYLKNPRSGSYSEQLNLCISGEIDLGIFERAWKTVIENNEMLRAVFRWEKLEHPVQVILREHKFQFDYYDLIKKNGIKTREHLEKIKANDRKKKFNLQEVPFRVTLCKINKDKYELIVSNHHILYDGWSNVIILKGFFTAYARLSKGNSIVPALKGKFKDFVRWSRNRDIEKEAAFWQNYLDGFDTQSGFPVKKRKTGTGTPGFEQCSFQFNVEEETRLKGFFKERKFTPASLFYSAWGILLRLYNNTDDIVFGTTVSGRSARVDGIENIVGLFINTLPLRSRAIPGEKVIDLIHRTDDTLRQREPYEQTPLVDIKSYSETGKNGELFDSILVIENYPLDIRLMSEESKIPLTVDSYTMVETTHYDLTVTISPVPRLQVVFGYNKGAFDSETVSMLSGHFRAVVNSLMEGPELETASMEILSAEEKETILYKFNDTHAEYPETATIHRLFEDRAERKGDCIALVGKGLGGACGSWMHLTYRELYEKANRLAGILRGKGIMPGVVVGIMIERSIEMIVGIMAVLKAGGAYLPIDPGLPHGRKKYILRDSATTLLLTRETTAEGLEAPCQRLNPGDPVLYRYETEIAGDPVAASDLAYVIYTSGSTGKPKGVIVEHRSAVNLLTLLQMKYPFLEQDVYLFKTSVVFDVSVTELFGWFLGGGRLTVLETGGEKDPKKIVDAVERHGVTHINFVPSMFNVFVEALDSTGIHRLTTLKYIFLAGEALLPELVEKFNRLQTGIPLENVYGPTEGTVYSSRYSLSHWKRNNRIPIGKPLPNIKLYILNRDGLLQPVGVPGELCIGGVGLARGYLNNPGLTNSKFQIPNHNAPYPLPLTSLYRSGDLARWMPGGNIEYLGRLDRQVKIRGFRVELGEIENRLLEHDAVKEVVVTVRSDKTRDKYLCAYFVPHGPGSCLGTALKTFLLEELPGYMIPLYFIPLSEIPLTPGGKVDRDVLPTPVPEPGVGHIVPRNKLEEKLAEIWARVLAVEKDIIGIDGNFFELGGHSLKATTLVSRIHKELDVRIPLEDIFKRSTIRAMSEYITGAKKENYIALEPVEKKEYYALSPAQKRLYFLHRMEESNTVYNMWGAFGLEDFFEKRKLEVTIGKLIARHESLRTSFVLIGEDVVQKIHEDADVAIEYHDAANPMETIIRDFIRPFDLSAAPLLRAGLVKTGEGRYVLLVDMHHIISDGISIEIFIKEFAALYTGKEPAAPKLHYKDFAGWQTGDAGSALITEREKYWLAQFGEEIPILDLPTDFARPPVRCFEGNTAGFEIGPKETDALNALALEQGATLYMVLLSVYNIFLSKLSGREDIVIGTPVAGRGHADLENIVGMFVNTLALRNYPAGEKSFGEFLEEVKVSTLKAFENQDYPFENLVEKAGAKGDKSRNPLFDVVFSLQNPDIPHMKIPGLTLKPYEHGNVNRVSKFDLTLRAVEVEDRLALSFEYSTKLFGDASIERFIAYFKKIVYDVLEDGDRKLSVIDVLSEEEKRRILNRFSHAVHKTGYPEDKTIHQLFREQAERTPDHTAVVFGGRHALTFRELDKKSDRPARLLREKGAEPGSITAILVKRSIEMIVGILGILKAGGAYLPIDPDYPGERIRFMLADSKAGILLSETGEFGGPGVTCELIGSKDWEQMAGMPDKSGFAHRTPMPGGGAYVIYTSGTTGRPKGALIEHRNVVRLMYNNNFPFDFGGDDVWTLFHSYCFDFSVWEMYGALLYGGKLIVISKMAARDPRRFLDIAKEEAVTVLNQTPAAFYNLADLELKSPGKRLKFRYIIFGGDALKPAKLKPWKEKYPETRLVNMFGITETTVHVTHKELEARDIRLNISNIGRPIPTLSTYVLDKALRPVPIGVPGELCVGGEGVCRGYLNRPELTAKKFAANPYLPGGRLYRSGDLAKLAADGQMEYLGRIDHQVKIRGHRIELGEIESQLLRHPEVKEVVVVEQRDSDGDSRLCAYIVPRPAMSTPAGPQLREYVSRFLPDYMVPSYFVEIENIPLTSNGKIDRKALPIPEVKSGARYTAPRDDTEMKLVEIWSGVLGTRAPIGIDDDFFELGGHSLKAALLISKIHKECSVKIPLPEIFGTPNIRGLANYIKAAVKDEYESITPVEEKEYYTLSSAQKRLYILQHADLENTAKNIPWIVFLDGLLEKEKLEAAFNKLVTRHESLRTSFQTVNDVPVQRVHNGIRLKIDYYDLAAAADRGKEKEIVKGFVKPFDLSRAPLLRVGLIKLDEKRHILLTDMHHIISDGTSLMILLDDFLRLHRGEELPSLGIQYKDFSCWQNRLFESGRIHEQENYWTGIYPDTRVIPELNLPIDYPRPPQLSYEADYFEFKPGVKETAALYQLCLETGTTLYMNLLALFNILLYKYTGQTDIITGTGVMGRRHIDLRNIIGMFINMLAVRNFPHGEKTYIAFLEEVKNNSLKAFENQDVQFEILVDKLKLKRDLSRNPLFDVAFTVNNFERFTPVTGGADAGGITFTPYEHGFITSVYDLVLDAAEVDEKICLTLKYKTRLFKRATVEKVVERYLDILEQVVENKNIKLGDIAVDYNLINAKSNILQGELDGFEF